MANNALLLAGSAYAYDKSVAYQATKHRYSSEAAAKRYLAQTKGTRRDLREKRCVLAALAQVPAGSLILDLPCGAGRLTECLARHGYQVVAADSSPGMIELARRNWLTLVTNEPELSAKATFHIQDVMATAYEDDTFDAVVCNRLIHHYPEPELRQAALRELARICRGPIVVSFFDLWTVDGIRNYASLCCRRPLYWDRCPVSRSRIVSEAEVVGLNVERFLSTRPLISPQTYAVFRRA